MPGQLAVDRLLLEVVVAAVDEVLVAGDCARCEGQSSVPPALEAAQKAVLRRPDLLILIIQPHHPVEVLPLLGNQSQLFRETRVLITA